MSFKINRNNLKNPKTKSIKEIYIELVKDCSDSISVEDYSIVGNVVFAGSRSSLNPNATFIEVVFFTIDDENIFIDTIRDSDNPDNYSCPFKILKYASGLGHSDDWVKKCIELKEENAKLKAMRKLVKVGDVVKIDRVNTLVEYLVTYADSKDLHINQVGGTESGVAPRNRVYDFKREAVFKSKLE